MPPRAVTAAALALAVTAGALAAPAAAAPGEGCRWVAVAFACAGDWHDGSDAACEAGAPWSARYSGAFVGSESRAVAAGAYGYSACHTSPDGTLEREDGVTVRASFLTASWHAHSWAHADRSGSTCAVHASGVPAGTIPCPGPPPDAPWGALLP